MTDEAPYAKGPFNGEDRVRIGRMDERVGNLVDRFDRFEQEVRGDRERYVTKAEFEKATFVTQAEMRPYRWVIQTIGAAIILGFFGAVWTLLTGGAV